MPDRCRSVVFGTTARRWLTQGRIVLRMILRLNDRGTWVAKGVLGCAYPRTERALAAIAHRGVHVLVNLHERSHDPRRLATEGLREVHLPVADFAAPSAEQVKRGVAMIREARAGGEAVAVHCGGGLGRTGTLLACYLVQAEGLSAQEAIERIRRIRPGSVERASQAAAVGLYAHGLQNTRQLSATGTSHARLETSANVTSVARDVHDLPSFRHEYQQIDRLV